MNHLEHIGDGIEQSSASQYEHSRSFLYHVLWTAQSLLPRVAESGSTSVIRLMSDSNLLLRMERTMVHRALDLSEDHTEDRFAIRSNLRPFLSLLQLRLKPCDPCHCSFIIALTWEYSIHNLRA